MKRVLIMAGGTGGHIFPALAVAKELIKQDISVHWMGTPQGMESRLVPENNIAISYITISGLRGKGIFNLLKAPWRLTRALIQAIKIIREFNPDLVLGLGGFASGPGGVAAKLLKKPLVIHEQNAVAGMTNKILGRMAQRVLSAFPQSFAPSYHEICVGNPVRQEIAQLPSPTARMKIHPTIRCLILGGSQGATALNQIIPRTLAQLPTVEIWHQSGVKDVETCQQLYRKFECDAKVEAFISDMAQAYAWADVVICRSGALTVFELIAAGVASILIPFPYAVDDHQTKNAEFLTKAAAGILIPQSELTIKNLMPLLTSLFEKPAKLLEMAEAARNLRMEDATLAVIKNCVEVCSG